MLLEFSLQSSAVHVQSPGRCGYIALVFIQHPLDMFPLHFLHRGRFLAQCGAALKGFKALYQLADGDRFAQIVCGATAHGLHRRGDTAVAGQYQYLQIVIVLQQLWQ